MLRAEKIGVDPEELANEYTQEHHRDFKDFLINFDNYYTTHSKENQELIEEIFSKLVKNNRIEKQIIEQAFDDKEQMFLPDRYVRGQCPECGAEDQYGDSCEDCGSTYKPTDLINPISVISGNKPSQKESEHYFLKLKLHFQELEMVTDQTQNCKFFFHSFLIY